VYPPALDLSCSGGDSADSDRFLSLALWLSHHLHGLLSWLHTISPVLFLLAILWLIWVVINWRNDWLS